MSTATAPLTRTDRLLAGVERAGNKLPDPFILFLGLFLLVGVISTVLDLAGTQVTLPGADEPRAVRGLFTSAGLTWFTTSVGQNFIGFPPLQTVLTILLAVTVAERTGFLGAGVRLLLGSAPRWALPYAVGIVGVTSSVMADACMIVVPPLAAMVFKAAGRHPMAGLIGGFAAAGAGYSTSPLVTSLDALFAGITNSVTAGLPDPGATVTPISNYFFNVAASVVLALLTGFVIDRVIEPRMVRDGVPTEEVAESDEADEDTLDDAETSGQVRGATPMSATLTAVEKRGFVVAALVTAGLAAVLAVAMLVPASPWRNPDGGFLPESPLLDSVVFLVFALFLAPGLVYGFVAGTLRTAADVPRVMGQGIKDMSSFIVLAFMLGQFIALFNWSNVGSVLAVNGARGLEGAGLNGFPAVLGFMVLCSLLNLFIVSGSSMWTLVGAVFVPMFALLGFEPGFIQGAFRVGDSATQVITPMNPYLFVLLMMVKRYEPGAGLGTVISRLLPFVVPFWLAWAGVLAVFYFAGLDMGPGVGIRIP